jgi:SAM-dependent methyltransferase
MSLDEHSDPKRIVEAGYDLVGDRYGQVFDAHPSPLREEYLGHLLDRLEPGSSVLEIGCGNGVPAARALAERHRVTGVDISGGQVERARRHVPGATFIKGDIMAADFPAASFDAALSFYAILHVPREEHRALLDRIHRWLRPGGWLLVNLAAGEDAGTVYPAEDGFFGVTMYFSHFTAERNEALVRGAGFDVLRAELREDLAWEDDGSSRPETFLWVLARKPAAAQERS